MARNSAWLGLVGLVVWSAVIALACANNDVPVNGGPQPPVPPGGAPIEPGPRPPLPVLEPPKELNLKSEDVGAHLEKKTYAAGLPSWLEASDDPMLAALPARAFASSGVVFSPSDESPTGETLWVHVFNDESEAMASDWVRYMASQPPTLVGVIVSHHELFGADLLPEPQVGDASVAIELFHGHSDICLYSTLLVFAQEHVLVFLFNSIEVTRATDDAAQAENGRGLPLHCNVAAAMNGLTEITAIAALISERLSMPPEGSASTGN